MEAPRYWLTGKLFCGHCGASMQGVSGTSKTRGKKHYYYYCKEQRRRKCRKKPVQKSSIENIVLKMLSQLLDNSETIASLAVDIAASLQSEQKYKTDKLRMLQDSKREDERQLDNLMKAILSGIFGETTQATMQELETRKKALTDEIELEERMRALSDDEVSIKHFFEQYQHADIDDPVVRDYLLENFVDRIYLYDDRIVMTCYYGSNTREIEWELIDEAVEADAAGGSTASFSVPPNVRYTNTVLKASVAVYRNEFALIVDVNDYESETRLQTKCATYAEIREWVKQEYGLHVSNLAGLKPVKSEFISAFQI